MERAALCFGNDGLRPPIGGCSAVMANGVYGRNYDFKPRHYGARFALVQDRRESLPAAAKRLPADSLAGYMIPKSPRLFGFRL